MADQQQQPRSGEEMPPVQQPSLANTEDTDHSIHLAPDYGVTGSTTAMSNALSPVDEDRQSRAKPKQPQNASSAQLSTSTIALPTSDHPHHSVSLPSQPLSVAIEHAVRGGTSTTRSRDVPAVSAPHLTNNIYQSPAMGPLTPPRSPLAGEVMYHNHHQQQQAMYVNDGGSITPPRKQSSSLKSKGSAKRSKSKSQKSGSKRSRKKEE